MHAERLGGKSDGAGKLVARCGDFVGDAVHDKTTRDKDKAFIS